MLKQQQLTAEKQREAGLSEQLAASQSHLALYWLTEYISRS